MEPLPDQEVYALRQLAQAFVLEGQSLLNFARTHDLATPGLIQIEKAIYGAAVTWFNEQAEELTKSKSLSFADSPNYWRMVERLDPAYPPDEELEIEED